MTEWCYGVVGLGIRDKKTMESHRRKGQAICYRQDGDRCEVWQYSSSSWVPVPDRSVDFVKLCELIGERAPGNRRLATRVNGIQDLKVKEINSYLMTPTHAAELLRRSPSRIYRWIQSGCPACAVPVNGQLRIMVDFVMVRAWAWKQGLISH